MLPSHHITSKTAKVELGCAIGLARDEGQKCAIIKALGVT